MNNLRRFFNQNRKKIIWITLIIVFLFLVLKLLDTLSGNKADENLIISNNNDNKINELITEKSLTSGQIISSSKLKSDTDVINEFINYCNNGEIQNAYNMLTDECKEVMFPNIDAFRTIYYNGNFNGEEKSCTIENWAGDIYRINLTGNILSTGDLTNTGIIQDYITLIEKDDEYKLNVNGYISRKIDNKSTRHNGLEVKIQTIDTYMDYEIYNLTIINDTDHFIFLGDCNDTDSIYLLDGYEMKYYFYGNEIAQNQLIISSNSETNLEIKFSNAFSSNRKLESLVFSKMIFNYNEYQETEDKENYEGIYIFKIEI